MEKQLRSRTEFCYLYYHSTDERGGLLKLAKRKILSTVVVGVLYAVTLLLLILRTNSNSVVYYKISPYAYASEILDFFFALIVSIPFSYYTFFMKKDGFLEYVSLRISKKKYIKTHFMSTMMMCFFMIFFVNIIVWVVLKGSYEKRNQGVYQKGFYRE